MVKTKKADNVDLIIKEGHHLTTLVDTHTGEFKMSWDWDALLREVQIATGSLRVQYVEVDVPEGKEEEFIGNVKEAVAKKKLVAATEEKIKKTRAKKDVVTELAKFGIEAHLVEETKTPVKKTRAKKSK